MFAERKCKPVDKVLCCCRREHGNTIDSDAEVFDLVRACIKCIQASELIQNTKRVGQKDAGTDSGSNVAVGFEHNVVYFELLQHVGKRQPGRATAYDDDFEALRHGDRT